MIRLVRFLTIVGFLVGLATAGPVLAESQPAGHTTAQKDLSVGIVSFGLSNEHTVFESEARGAAAALAQYFDVSARSATVRYNSRRAARADVRSLRAEILKFNRRKGAPLDILAVALTSHGSNRGIVVLNRRASYLMSPQSVGRVLNVSTARYRILIVSACYSGIFADALADARTLVITAASSDRSSFGCSNELKWTFFGDAFFNASLKPGIALPEVFDRARSLIAKREESEGYTSSNPQIRGGEEVLQFLRTHLAKEQKDSHPAGLSLPRTAN